jgi:23S rRNA (guanosine2251-2'-O)-methyltransferase
VAKVAAGALEHLPVARVVNLNRSLDQLKQEGYRVIGLAGEGTVTLEEADLEGPLVVVTGSEGDGLSLLTRRSCDQLVRIPLRGATPSLNASVATALLLYEIARRGWMRGLSGTAPAPRIVRPALPTPAASEPEADPQSFESEAAEPEIAEATDPVATDPVANDPAAEEAPWHAVVAAVPDPEATLEPEAQPEAELEAEPEPQPEPQPEPEPKPEPEPSAQPEPSLSAPVTLELPSFSSSGFEGDIRL